MEIPLKAKWHTSINEIPEESWRLLTGDSISPFYQWQWLKALEKSESISNEKGVILYNMKIYPTNRQ